ncbi:MAG: deoxyribose-phosphate aldolase [Lachnospiraceae bacterium]|jgi:deoxyribose-phosphate aldolase|nr:deoxyribose-phosphate aldolase [Lachnospiraceae bacterium]MDD4524937.1 deoxyribose-phosphate aldolase [Lachnospiraceae bacterium]
MDIEKICAACDHTLLKQDSTWEQIKALCDEGMKFHASSVCIPPCYVAGAAQYLDGRLPVTVVIGFPNGYNTTKVKIAEAEDAIANGASELDMVINVGWVKSGRFDLVENEIKKMREVTKGHILKVIIECCLLTEEEKKHMCRIVTEAGADFIKTSTGFSTGGATISDVKLLRANVGPDVKVKAAGGIHSLVEAENFLNNGADRLGTSSVISQVSKL